jgi:hypothetical protein
VVGKHWRRKRVGRLVCPAVGDAIDAASNIRECADCGWQVWVSVGASTALVDSGELDPQCPDCWLDSGKVLTLHSDSEAELTAARLRQAGWERVGELNAQLEAETW